MAKSLEPEALSSRKKVVFGPCNLKIIMIVIHHVVQSTEKPLFGYIILIKEAVLISRDMLVLFLYLYFLVK